MMGLREYSRHRKCTLRAVQKAIAAGRIKLKLVDGRKMIDSDQADRDWRDNTDPGKQSLLHSAGPQVPVVPSPAPVPPAEGDTPPEAAGTAEPGQAAEDADEHNPIYRKARAEQMAIRVAREQIELDQLRGSLISLEDAKRLAFTAFRSLRDAVLNVPARIKDQCAVEIDAFKVEQLLEAELTAALQSFNPAKVLNDVDDDEAD